MHISKVHPELRKIIARIPAIPFHNRLFLSLLNLFIRIPRKPACVAGVSVTEQVLEFSRVRIYRPTGALSGAGLLWIHGGGLITGAAAMSDRECSTWARDLQLSVVSVGYRLAPRHPFPAAIDDCYAAWQWMQQAASILGLDPARIVLAGQSAGGGLAASLAQRVHDVGGVQPAGQALFCPMLDDRTAANVRLDALEHHIWNNHNNRAAWTWYLGQPAGQVQVPAYAVPARCTDLSGLPPAWIAVGDIDLFYGEGWAYAERLSDVGVPCEFYPISMAPHGFEAFAPEATLTRDLYCDFYRFLRQALKL